MPRVIEGISSSNIHNLFLNFNVRLAKHLVSLYYPVEEDVEGQQRLRAIVPQDFLKEYIQYARYAVTPVISDDAVELLVQVS